MVSKPTRDKSLRRNDVVHSTPLAETTRGPCCSHNVVVFRMHDDLSMTINTSNLLRLVKGHKSAGIAVLLVHSLTPAHVFSTILSAWTFACAHLAYVDALAMPTGYGLVLSVFSKQERYVCHAGKNTIACNFINRQIVGIDEGTCKRVLKAYTFPALVPHGNKAWFFLVRLIKIRQALIPTDVQGISLSLIALWLIVHKSTPKLNNLTGCKGITHPRHPIPLQLSNCLQTEHLCLLFIAVVLSPTQDGTHPFNANTLRL